MDGWMDRKTDRQTETQREREKREKVEAYQMELYDTARSQL